MNKIYRKQFFRHRGVSCVGLAMMMLCLSLAGVFWLKASSLDGRVRTAPVVDVHPQTKNIEDVKAGDRVWAYDAVNDQWKAEPVIKSLVHDYTGDMVSISVAGQTINCTGNHPFWVAGGANLFDRLQSKDVDSSDRDSAVASGRGRWIEARNLQAGDMLALRDGRQVPIVEVQLSYGRHKVYNLDVAELHTYAVADAGVAVHNCALNCFPPGTLILMGDGSVKPIEQVELGDQVMAGDPLATGPPHGARVTGLIRDFTAHLAIVRFETSTSQSATVTSTQDHPFWTNNRGWVVARNLRAGDQLQDSERNALVVTTVTVRPHIGRTYNLEIQNLHTYYALADDRKAVLVHNQAMPSTPFPGPVVNIGGEGELKGAINVQPPNALEPGWSTSGRDASTFGPTVDTPVEGGLPITQIQGPVVIADPNALPFQTGQIPTVVTNGVPVDRPPTIYGPSANSAEVQRILAPGGQWINTTPDSTTTYIKPPSP